MLSGRFNLQSFASLVWTLTRVTGGECFFCLLLNHSVSLGLFVKLGNLVDNFSVSLRLIFSI